MLEALAKVATDESAVEELTGKTLKALADSPAAGERPVVLAKRVDTYKGSSRDKHSKKKRKERD